jgi:hypothetical protein
MNRNAALIPALTIPTSGDTIYFDLAGRYTILVDVPNIEIGSIYIGNNLSFPTIQILSGVNFIVAQAMYCHINCVVNAYRSAITFGNFSLYGTFNYYGDSSVTQNYFGGIQSSALWIYGVFNYINSRNSVLFSNCNLTISSSGMFNHIGSAPILSDTTNSRITNYGVYNATNMRLSVPVLNLNIFIVYGQNSTSYLTSQFVVGSNSTFYLMNSTLVSDGNFTIGAGYSYLSGVVRTPQFAYDSQDGFLQLIAPYKLTIVGDSTFTSRSTIILTLNGLGVGQSDSLNVTGTLHMNSLTLLKLGNRFVPKVDDRIPFLLCGGVCLSDIQQISLLGAPYKSAKYSFDSTVQQVGYFQIIFSFGSVENDGYQCTYLGDKRILEMNPIQDKWVLSLTIPIRS